MGWTRSGGAMGVWAVCAAAMATAVVSSDASAQVVMPRGGRGPVVALNKSALSHIPPLTDPVNTNFLSQLSQKNQKKCGPQEVSPGVWVRIDCGTYRPVSR